MNLSGKFTLLHVRSWSMIDQNTNNNISGYTVHFMGDYVEDTNQRGVLPIKASCSQEFFAQARSLPKVPCEINAQFILQRGSNNSTKTFFNKIIKEG